jgi:hypothetical protein
VTADPEQLSTGEQRARQAYRDDFQKITNTAKQLGHLPADLYHPDAIAAAQEAAKRGPDPRTMTAQQHYAAALRGERPAVKPPEVQPLDSSRMSASQLIEAGLRQQRR